MEIKVYYVIKFLVYIGQILIGMNFLDNIKEDGERYSISNKIITFILLFIGLVLFEYKNVIMIIYYYIIFCLYICKKAYKFSKIFWIIHFITDSLVVQGTMAFIFIGLVYDSWMSYIEDVSYYKSFVIVLILFTQFIVLRIHLIEKKNKLVVDYLNENMMRIFAIIFISIQIAFICLIRNNVLNKNMASVYECILSGILLCFNLFIYKVIKFVIKETKEKYKLQMNVEQVSFQKAYLEQVHKKYDEISLWKHDYKNNVNIILSLAMENKKEQLDKYIKDCDEEISSAKTMVFTTVFVIDSIITIKYIDAIDKGIDVELKCCKVNQGDISDFDLNIILSNLLDNAIEAAQKSKDKKIIISIYQKKYNLVVDIKNSTDGNIKYSNGIFVSTKSGSLTGLGLLRVKETLKKYNGNMIIEINSMFENKIIIPYEGKLTKG